MLETLTQSLESVWRSFESLLPQMAAGFLVLLLFYLAGQIARRIIHGIVAKTKFDSSLGALIGRLSSAIITIIGFFVAAVVAFPAFKAGDLVAGLGLTSVLIGFAFKDILQNFFAGLLILWRRPFRAGDEIRSGSYEGKVEDINMRSTRIKTYDGERAVLPNSQVYTNVILVRTAYPIRRSTFTVGIAYEDSIDEARSAIMDALAKMGGVKKEPGPWVYVSAFADSSVNLTVYFWTSSEQHELLRINDEVASTIKLALDAAGVSIPYPHRVVRLEGNPESTA